MNTAAHRELAQALGPEAVELREPQGLLGVRPGLVVRPADPEGLAAALRILSGRGLSALVRGSGSRLAVGNPPARADVVLETGGLDAPLRIEADEGVAHAPAGAPLWRLQEAAHAEGWEVLLDPPGASATVGGTLAQAAVGPGSPHPRDLVLGLEVVLADGRATRCGGRVVKNVTGYDLAKLYVGSHGSLGVIAGAWLRLHPQPESRANLECALAEGPAAWQAALAAARRPTTRVAALVEASLLDPQATGFRLVVALAGDAAAVEVDRGALLEEGATEALDETSVDAVRGLQGTAGPVRVRVSCRATGLSTAGEVLRGAGARVLAYPGKGLLWGVFPDPDPVPAVATARRAAQAAGGHTLLEEAPLEGREAVDAFDVPEPLLPLHRALKSGFDPEGVLNPGRFGGRL